MKAIDLFAGLGGWSAGAKMAGVDVLWAANHWPEAVRWHAENHPGTAHVWHDASRATAWAVWGSGGNRWACRTQTKKNPLSP